MNNEKRLKALLFIKDELDKESLRERVGLFLTATEESYDEFYKKTLSEFGAKELSDLSIENKVLFFKAIDDGWESEVERLDEK